ncbi:MAG: crossover junction endodeoxyribonuclease RuvC [Patescibacteria group bacterium]|nr:crossover junction endodeoxyribonuclease RuvC [Patescibacteria group bacterium]MDE2438474.1 crossover junction endodeoxyribonuclease RuvC [Patescibacteria group bacterium]
MTILGIDPGTTRIGFGIVHKEGSAFRASASGLFEYPQDSHRFEKEFTSLIATHKPEAAAIEKIFFAKNQKTALEVTEMRGVIKFLIQKQNIPILEFTPLEVKQYITGYGRADKKQLETMTLKVLALAKKPKYDDESDALAIALCGALAYPMHKKTKVTIP